MNNERKIAYFSMEVGLETDMPTYSGGLGVLAGDTIRSAAELNVPMVAVTLLHRHGYFYQKLNENGIQTEEPVKWVVEDFLKPMEPVVTVNLENRQVRLMAWQYDVNPLNKNGVPVYFLDTDIPENSEWDRALTDHLYGGDTYYRLCQEIILGIGGVRMLRALGHDKIERFHMNEGHAAFLTLELLKEHCEAAGRDSISDEDIEAVRNKCVFTTHTPVPAGQDKFPMEEVKKLLNGHPCLQISDSITHDGSLNMTYLALTLSHYVNGVAKKHGEVSSHMYAPYRIDSITNGVHVTKWTSQAFSDLFDKYIPGWREDNFNLRYALSIPAAEIWEAHQQAKRRLIHYINRETNKGMDADVLTLGFARRAATYKRADLLLSDPGRLKDVYSKAGPFQIVYAGKAHPKDQQGKELIQRIFQAIKSLNADVKIAYLENYDMELGKLLTSGVDLWINTPLPPMEASGTSGMKAALNGVPSFSIPDGWWIEGCIEGITGWAIGQDGRDLEAERDTKQDAAALFDKLESTIIPLYYNQPEQFRCIMAHCIALNGSFFNTQRMV
ncbi:MAG: alpha-glucan family phosphorylase, partial [Sedimentisphaerales bacterium]|nr:alpha-glucan family phosphorylase [Sedimentisphaerales bacterium]